METKLENRLKSILKQRQQMNGIIKLKLKKEAKWFFILSHFSQNKVLTQCLSVGKKSKHIPFIAMLA